MRHHLHNTKFQFIVEPEEFDKYTDRDLLQYTLGAVMYMPGTKDFLNKIVENKIPELTTMVFCFEDACPEEDVEKAEENVHQTLKKLHDLVESGQINKEIIPLIFVRIRNMEQFKHFSEKLTKQEVSMLTGINFPKFNSDNGFAYYQYLRELNERFEDILYGMPILEDSRVAFKESRMEELMKIKEILDENKDLVLQVRVGATDFSSNFGVRRGVDHSIYDVLTVRDCLADILNVLGRNNDYVISGPVWEYFRASKQMMFEELPVYEFEDRLRKFVPIYNQEIDGLLREIMLDRANGFVGRTVIHPTHVRFVNGLQAVTLEEYDDAVQILGNKNVGGVLKGASSNKMNEIKPHMNWAEKIEKRARAFGVIPKEKSYINLFGMEKKEA